MLDPKARVAALYANTPGESGAEPLRNVGFNIIESITKEPNLGEKDLGDHSTDST